MTVKNGFNGSFGYAQNGLLGVHRDQTKWIALNEPPSLETEIAQIDARLFTPGAHHLSIERLQGMFKCSGSFIMPYHPEEGIEFFKGVFGTVTSTELTGAGSGIYEHEFLGSNTLPMAKGFSFTIDTDGVTRYISGAFITTIEMGVEIDGIALATVNWVAKKWEVAADGTSGTSQGSVAVTFPATIVDSTSDDFKIAIDGGVAYECTIAAGAYATAATLEAAINAAILAQTSLQDTDKEPEVACYIDSNSKVNFYSADKGTGAQITWTAGSNDANTILGYGTPVEAVGTAVLATPVYSSVAPFVSTQVQVVQDSVNLCVESLTVTIDTKQVVRNCLGRKYASGIKSEGKRVVTVAYTKDYEDEVSYDAWQNNSNVSIDVEFRTNTEIVALSGVNYDSDFFLKLCRINNSPEPAFNGEGTMTQEVTAQSFYYNSTYGDGKLDVNNTLSSMRG